MIVQVYMQLKGIKVRLYPNKEQQNVLDRHFGACRFIYNQCLDYKKTIYKTYGKNISKYDLFKELTQIKTLPEYLWLNEIKAECLQNTISNLDSAYQNFYKGKKFPKFKSKKSNNSFTSTQNFKILNNANKLIFYSQKIKFKCSIKDIELIRTSKIKRITYAKDKCNHYYASILIESNENLTLSKIDKEIGIDLGLNHFLVTSDNEFICNPRYFRKSEKNLKKLQKKHSRKKKGSKNREKSKLKVTKCHKKIVNQRNYFLHQVSNKIISENQTIYIENLNVKGMMQNGNLAKSIQDVGWGYFTIMLNYKALWTRRTIEKIDRWYPSSKTCSNCEHINHELILKDRIFHCDNCGYEEDRDYNAAKNILNYKNKNRDESTQINASGEQDISHSMKEEPTYVYVE